MGERPRLPPNLALLISIIAVSTASILIRWTEAPPLAIASYRMLLSVAMLTPFFIRNNGIEKLRKQGNRAILILGLFDDYMQKVAQVKLNGFFIWFYFLLFQFVNHSFKSFGVIHSKVSKNFSV